MRIFWTICGLLSLGLGILGIFLPLLPTTPLVILAAWCFAKSSPRLHGWLLGHRTFGPMILDWRDHRAIRPRAKRAAITAMVLVLGFSLWLGVRWEIIAVQAAVLCIMGTWILTRPSGPQG
jgi:uncharacterized protein